MLVNTAALDLAFKGFKTVVTTAMMQAPAQYEKIAMTVPSSSRDETYGWLGQFPALREWVGPRHIKNLVASSFTLTNKKFESTVSVKRDDFSDDKLGLFKPFFAEMGNAAARHPDELLFGLLKSGFTANGYDGQFFFDTDHPVVDQGGQPISVANTDGGSGTPWFLLDTTRAVRPLIWQTREDYEFQQLNKSNDDHVFFNDEYVYGMRARVNAGFGLWQLAWGSKQTLNAANYAFARAAMSGFKADGGRIMGITPKTLVVPPSLEEAALNILNTEIGAGGASNPWKGTAELIVTPYLA